MIFEAVLLFSIVGYESTLCTQFKMVRGQANNFTVEDIEREEDLEFPRNNERIRNLVHEMWQKYYTCLLTKDNKDRKPEIRRLLEGQYTELKCDVCPRPFQDYDELEWKYRPLVSVGNINELEYLDLTPEMIYTENKTIQIFNAIEEVSGLYVCYHKLNVASVYILEVTKNDTIQKMENFHNKGLRTINSQGKEFQVFYQWREWTECSACGRVGKKYKYATCFVIPKKKNTNHKKGAFKNKPRKYMSTKHLEKLAQDDVIFSSDFFKRMKEKIMIKNLTAEDANSPDWDLEIIEKFSTGIPCASQYLPKSIFPAVQNYPAVKVVVKFCWEPCRETEIFEVFDNTGMLVEWANNTAGVYSVFQKIPQLPHDIERRTVAAAYGTDIIILCPGTSFTNTPVVWKLNNRIIFPDIIANESNGRFTIDLVNRINLKKLRLKDSRIYSCWQKDKLVGTVHLNVEKNFKIRLDHHVTLIIITAVIGTLLLLATKIIAREWKMRNK